MSPSGTDPVTLSAAGAGELGYLLLVSPTDYYRGPALLELVLQKLVDGERNSLSGRDTHYPRRDALIERMEAFLSVRQQNVSKLIYIRWWWYSVPWGLSSRRRERPYLNISPAILVILCSADTPGSAGIFCSLVLMVSMGALLSGPMAPLTSPMSVVW